MHCQMKKPSFGMNQVKELHFEDMMGRNRKVKVIGRLFIFDEYVI